MPTLSSAVAAPGVKRAARSVYLAAGRRSARFRVAPDFILIGGQRCGTTSLFMALKQHPQFVRPALHKGVNYFDVNYHRGPEWYAGHFPLAAFARRRLQGGGERMVFEASGYYMFHPMALERIVRDLPSIKLVAMLRDPVERSYSAWKHEYERGFEKEDFMTALSLEDSRLSGEIERMVAEPMYQSYAHRHHAYRRRGEYQSLLAPVISGLARSQLHVMYSEDFFSNPVEEFCQLNEFLAADPYELTQFEQYNARPSKSMPESARQALTEHFGQHRQALEALVGRPAPWPVSA